MDTPTFTSIYHVSEHLLMFGDDFGPGTLPQVEVEDEYNLLAMSILLWEIKN